MKFVCPRRSSANQIPSDFWRKSDGACSYCGSLNPDEFMARLELADVELEPTDKSYKVYVCNLFGDKFKATHRTDEKPFQGWDSPDHEWVIRDVDTIKFYFQHLSEEQMKAFIVMLNEDKLHIGPPGYFYVRPYFITYD